MSFAVGVAAVVLEGLKHRCSYWRGSSRRGSRSDAQSATGFGNRDGGETADSQYARGQSRMSVAAVETRVVRVGVEVVPEGGIRTA